MIIGGCRYGCVKWSYLPKNGKRYNCGRATIPPSSSACAGWPYGALYVLEAIWKHLGIDAIVRQQAGTRHLGFDAERALFANRACALVSKLYCHEQWLKEDAHIDGTQTLKLHPFYRAWTSWKRTRKPSNKRSSTG